MTTPNSPKLFELMKSEKTKWGIFGVTQPDPISKKTGKRPVNFHRPSQNCDSKKAFWYSYEDACAHTKNFSTPKRLEKFNKSRVEYHKTKWRKGEPSYCRVFFVA